jgi:caffeoyl-CoA O-methyltransferase
MADNESRAGMTYATPQILNLVEQTHGGHDTALTRAFKVPEGVPAIQVSPSDGRLIYTLMKLANVKKAVEIGTLAGYSAIHMARGMAKGGRLWSLEYEQRHAELARANLAAAGLSQTVTVLVGQALDVLPKLVGEGLFDAVFIDADKVNYDRYGLWALENLRPGGLVIGDNAYLFGELLGDKPEAQAMRRFHELVSKTCESVCAPTPDGLVVGIKR